MKIKTIEQFKILMRALFPSIGFKEVLYGTFVICYIPNTKIRISFTEYHLDTNRDIGIRMPGYVCDTIYCDLTEKELIRIIRKIIK